jgi:hypothetical protein
MLNDPVQRAILAKRNVMESRKDYNEDTLSEFDRSIVGAKSAQLRLRLTDAEDVMRHLAIIENGIHQLRLAAAKQGKDRSRLLLVGSTIREINRKINAKRWD